MCLLWKLTFDITFSHGIKLSIDIYCPQIKYLSKGHIFVPSSSRIPKYSIGLLYNNTREVWRVPLRGTRQKKVLHGVFLKPTKFRPFQSSRTALSRQVVPRQKGKTISNDHVKASRSLRKTIVSGYFGTALAGMGARCIIDHKHCPMTPECRLRIVQFHCAFACSVVCQALYANVQISRIDYAFSLIEQRGRRVAYSGPFLTRDSSSMIVVGRREKVRAIVEICVLSFFTFLQLQGEVWIVYLWGS